MKRLEMISSLKPRRTAPGVRGIGRLVILLLVTVQAQAERIKDLASIAGVRSNQLIGYGLVVGLDGSGDKRNAAPYTMQSLKTMLTQLGIVVPPDIKIKPKNVAAVIVHAELPPFAKNGQTIDVTVSSIGDSTSLRGGSLMMAPLKGADGRVYALAQGSLLVSGLSADGADGSSVTVNIPSVGRIPNGATVERTVPTLFNKGNYLTLILKRTDFTTANRMAVSINQSIGEGTAKAIDADLELVPGMAPARVVVNSRTGTVVISANVRVTPAAVAHGNMTVTISENAEVSQPGPFARRGRTEVVDQSDVGVSEEAARMFLFKPGTTLDDVVRAVNRVGAAPSDLVAILEALKQAGALKAELIII